MAVDRQFKNRVYGIGDTTFDLPPEPIVAQRAPTSSDRAQIGSIWIDQTTQNGYILVSVAANVSSWQIMTAEGTGGTDGQLLIGATGADPDWANLTSTGGTLVITNGTNTINLEATGGTTSSFPTDSGTANPLLGATNIAGGTNLNTAGAGSTVTVNLDASPSVAGSLTAGVDLNMTSGDCTISADSDAARTIYLHADGGTSETIELRADQGTGSDSLNLLSDVGGITLNAGLAAANSIIIDASNVAGGIDCDYGTGGMTVTGGNGAFTLATGTGAINLGADAVAHTITVGNATGATAVNVNCGTGGATFGTSANAHATTVGGTNTTSTTTIQSGTGGVIVTSTDEITLDAAGVLELNSSAGIIGIGNDAVAQNINIGTGAAARTITIGNVTGATALAFNAGTGGIGLASTGAGDITIDSDDTLLLDSDGVLELNSSAGIIGIGNDADAFGINIGTGAAQRDIVIGNITGTTGIDVNAGSGDIVLTSTDSIISMSSGTGAINIGADAAAKTITVGNATGATSVVINAGTGAVNIGTNAIAHTTTVGTTTGAADTTIQSGTGGISIEAAGIVDMVPATDSQAATTVTINANVGVGTFTGQTTASAASVTLTVTNSVCTTGSAILCSVSTMGTNDAQLTIQRVEPKAGSFEVTCKNNGAAAVNGNIILTFWIIAA